MRITTTASAACSDVLEEMTARVDGQFGTWHDPHNNGTYTNTNLSLPMQLPPSKQSDYRISYRNADAIFPNYALNYPTPVHGNISPSRQYPPQVKAISTLVTLLKALSYYL